MTVAVDSGLVFGWRNSPLISGCKRLPFIVSPSPLRAVRESVTGQPTDLRERRDRHGAMTQSGLDCSAVVVELHPADAKTSLAFLKAYLPHSLPVCASILCGPIESPLNGDDSFTEPWAYAWTTLTPGDLERRSSNTGWDNSEYPDYVFIVQLAGSMRHQTRIFCSAECPRPDESAEDQLDRRKRGSHLVRGAVERYLRITKTVTVLGAVHQYWLAELYEALGMEYTERLTDLWLEPTRETGQGQGGQVDRIRGYEEGYQYSVDEANGEDCQLVSLKL